ncbi:glutathione S-transferase [Neisseriaceae bacterium PsAf]|nr:glutathione S-transferase [Neisseriaceae bacterium PsAf]
MILIGMLDSPYVRRLAISLKIKAIDFELQPLSVFSNLEMMQTVNPLLKVPMLITNSGIKLWNSSLILEYIELVYHSKRKLLPSNQNLIEQSQSIISIVLAICEKAIQLYYEYNLRPEQKQHEDWINRITKQLNSGLDLLDKSINLKNNNYLITDKILQADITLAVVLKFIEDKLPEVYTNLVSDPLQQFSQQMESLEVFQKTYSKD